MRSDQLRAVRHGPTVVAYLGPEYSSLDEQLMDEVEHFLFECIDPDEIKNLVVDMSSTKFFASLFIEVLFRAHNRIQRKQGQFAISGLRGHPLDVILISKLEGVLGLVPTAEEAVQKFNSAGSPPAK